MLQLNHLCLTCSKNFWHHLAVLLGFLYSFVTLLLFNGMEGLRTKTFILNLIFQQGLLNAADNNSQKLLSYQKLSIARSQPVTKYSDGSINIISIIFILGDLWLVIRTVAIYLDPFQCHIFSVSCFSIDKFMFKFMIISVKVKNKNNSTTPVYIVQLPFYLTAKLTASSQQLKVLNYFLKKA